MDAKPGKLLDELCAKAHDQYGDNDKAIDFMRSSLASLNGELAVVEAFLIDRGIRDVYAAYRHRLLQQIMRGNAHNVPKPGPAARTGAAIGAVGRIVAESILDTLFVCGKVLGDCTGTELDEEADAARERAKGFTERAQLLRAFRAAMDDPDKRLRECVSGKRADEIYRTICGSGDALGTPAN